jgi:hypothetical protein
MPAERPHPSSSDIGTLRVEISYQSDMHSRFTKVLASDKLTRALGSANYFHTLIFAGGIYATSFVAWVAIRADRLRVIGCLRAPRAGRRQLRRPGLHQQSL